MYPRSGMQNSLKLPGNSQLTRTLRACWQSAETPSQLLVPSSPETEAGLNSSTLEVALLIHHSVAEVCTHTWVQTGKPATQWVEQSFPGLPLDRKVASLTSEKLSVTPNPPESLSSSHVSPISPPHYLMGVSYMESLNGVQDAHEILLENQCLRSS